MEQRESTRGPGAHDAPHARPHRARPVPAGAGRVTFVLDRDLRVQDIVAPTGFHGAVHHWMDLVDEGDRAAAYDALSRALVSHRLARCELRFTRFWVGHVLTCTFLRDPRTVAGYLVHVDAP